MSKTNNQYTYATVESLTGGTLAALFTSCSGSSNYYIGGTVAYNESVKRDLGITTIDKYCDTTLAIDLANASPIKADVIISTTGYIDSCYSYCIIIGNEEHIEHIEIDDYTLSLPRPTRQIEISRHILYSVYELTHDKNLQTIINK